ncbi:MAG: LptA/OstA family protein [Leptospirales bacterium]
MRSLRDNFLSRAKEIAFFLFRVKGRMGRYSGILAMLGFSLFLVRTSMAAQPVTTVINADRMLAENIQNEVHFIGHVHLVKKSLILKSDSLDVFFVPPAKGATLMDNMHARQKTQKIQTMVARGHVYIKKGGRVAYAGKAVYIAESHLFVLTRLPVVIQNGDRISGERITFFTRINKSLVQGHSLMLLHPQPSGDKSSSQHLENGRR